MNPENYSEAAARRCSVKKVFLEILQHSQENTCVRASFLITLQAWACNFIKKETLAQVFSCGFCEIPKNSFSYIIEILADICYSVKLLKATIKQLWVPKILDIQATLRARTWPMGRDLWGIGRGLWKNEYIWINPSSLSCIVEKWPNTF